MAYFSNGTANEVWQIRNCHGCAHDDPETGCAVMLVHLAYNYEQCDNKHLMDALNLLIPENGDGAAGRCTMRLPAAGEQEQPR